MGKWFASALLAGWVAGIPVGVSAQVAAGPPASSVAAVTPDAPTSMAPVAAPTAADPLLEARMLAITEELRCLVCQNQTIAESHADLAADLRTQVRQQLASGKSPDEIRHYMTDRYGDFILYKPPLKATTLALWLGPAALLALGASVLVVSIRRRARLPDDRFEPDPPPDEAIDRPAAGGPEPPATTA